MVSHKEVADAFIAAAAACGVSGKELGQMLAFLAYMPNWHLENIPITAGNEAIVEFVRAAYWKSRGRSCPG